MTVSPQSSGIGMITSGVRSCASTEKMLSLFVLASVPAHVVWAWRTGRHVLVQEVDVLIGWRVELLQLSNGSLLTDDIVSCLVSGALFTLPLLIVSTAVGFAWAQVFSRLRGRSLDPGWFVTSWLYVLLVPADLPLPLAAIGISFAAVIGQHIFGGTGRYIVSPAALGALFVQFSYPTIGAVSVAATWDTVVAAGASSVDLAVDPTILAMTLACAAGAVLLARADALAWRTVAGAVIGLALGAWFIAQLTDLAVAELPWYGQLMLGGVPVCLAFVITDPSTASLTKVGRWLHGFVFGLLIIGIRVFDPSHPDSSLSAVLIATLAVPLIDYCVTRTHIARTNGRLELRR